MAMKLFRLALALALVSPAWPSSEGLEARGKTPNQKCHGQSCQIASLSGSSGKPYKAKKAPKDMTLAGDCCLLKYNPSARARLYRQTPGLKERCEGGKSVSERSEDEILGEEDEFAEIDLRSEIDALLENDEFEDFDERAACKPKTLIFAKGTTETGPIGNSVGPALQSGLDASEPGQWAVHGVRGYRNNEFENTCLGHRGGAQAAALLEKVAARCPKTKIIMSGYSQGSMVTRNGVAFSKRSSHKRLRGYVSFGDPFNGAPIKKYNKPIVVFCNKGDRVCDGRNIITDAHLAYVGGPTDRAVQRMIKLTS